MPNKDEMYTPRSGRTLLGATLALALLAWVIGAVNTCIAYVALGMDWIPIGSGILLLLFFGLLLTALNNRPWLAFLSILPALFVLVGSVQYAPELALERRGIRESVVITGDSAQETGGNNHRYVLRREDAVVLDEKLGYDGSGSGYRVGDRIQVIRDPEGLVPLEDAATVDPAGELDTLLIGTVGLSALALLAGRRGHVLRRRDREREVSSRL
ncbi:hypothetical protein [Streptomyces sp. NBC_01565]|uniref:hypothetical protein n=1 Tax=unclassified Streptomyces TaxID=2593676 RepID=UPI00224FEFD2|nr:hypothetical protein [Streptomyces sp. NBC_01565]MCX4546274.1 hypothetical protein [Streptomyces sp. NBC_01565]